MSSVHQYEFQEIPNNGSFSVNVANLNSMKKHISGSRVHSLMYYDITLITDGTGFFQVDDKKYIVSPKDIIFSIPGEIRKWDVENIKKGYVLMLEEEFLQSCFNSQELSQRLPYFNPNRLSAKMTLDDISFKKAISLITEIKEEMDKEVKDSQLSDRLVYEILTSLQREHILVEQSIDFPNRISGWHVNNFIKLVNAEYITHQNINYYAERLCLTPNYLNEIVKKTIGVNAKQFILNKVALKAKRMLVRTRLSVKEISDQLNFSSSSYFIRFFHKQTGGTPLQYRHSIKTISRKRE